jgi:hypothetical protein
MVEEYDNPTKIFVPKGYVDLSDFKLTPVAIAIILAHEERKFLEKNPTPFEVPDLAVGCFLARPIQHYAIYNGTYQS